MLIYASGVLVTRRRLGRPMCGGGSARAAPTTGRSPNLSLPVTEGPEPFRTSDGTAVNHPASDSWCSWSEWLYTKVEGMRTQSRKVTRRSETFLPGFPRVASFRLQVGRDKIKLPNRPEQITGKVRELPTRCGKSHPNSRSLKAFPFRLSLSFHFSLCRRPRFEMERQVNYGQTLPGPYSKRVGQLAESCQPAQRTTRILAQRITPIPAGPLSRLVLLPHSCRACLAESTLSASAGQFLHPESRKQWLAFLSTLPSANVPKNR